MTTVVSLIAVLMYIEGITFWVAISTMINLLMPKPVSFPTQLFIVAFWPIVGPIAALMVYRKFKDTIDSARQFQNLLQPGAFLTSDDETATS